MAEIRFTKMHGAGNDYVYVSTFDQTLDTDLASLAREVSDRHFGIGGDGMILIHPSEVARMRGCRCSTPTAPKGKCVETASGASRSTFTTTGPRRTRRSRLKPVRGVLSLDVETDSEDTVRQVRVNMGRPILEGAKIPTTFDGRPGGQRAA